MASICLPRIEQIQQMAGFQAEPCHLSFCGKDGRPIPETMAKRNARERTRVHQLNATFDVLRKRLPVGWRKGRISKCGILRKSTEYIKCLLEELSKPADKGIDQGLYTHQREIQLTRGQHMPFGQSNKTSSFSESCGLSAHWTGDKAQYPLPINTDFNTNDMGMCSENNQEFRSSLDNNFEESNFSSCMYQKYSQQLEEVESHTVRSASLNCVDIALYGL